MGKKKKKKSANCSTTMQTYQYSYDAEYEKCLKYFNFIQEHSLEVCNAIIQTFKELKDFFRKIVIAELKANFDEETCYLALAEVHGYIVEYDEYDRLIFEPNIAYAASAAEFLEHNCDGFEYCDCLQGFNCIENLLYDTIYTVVYASIEKYLRNIFPELTAEDIDYLHDVDDLSDFIFDHLYGGDFLISLSGESILKFLDLDSIKMRDILQMECPKNELSGCEIRKIAAFLVNL